MVSEFSQSKVIEALSSSSDLSISPEQKKIITGGICYALSLEWLCASLGKPTEELGKLLPFEPTGSFNAKTQAYYKQIAGGFIAYAETIYRQHGVSADQLLTGVNTLPKDMPRLDMDNYFCGLWSKDHIRFDSADDINDAAALNGLLTNLPLHMFFMSLRLRDGGHRVALLNRSGDIYFFDPNFGVYLINDLNAFFTDLSSTYHRVSSYVSSSSSH